MSDRTPDPMSDAKAKPGQMLEQMPSTMSDSNPHTMSDRIEEGSCNFGWWFETLVVSAAWKPLWNRIELLFFVGSPQKGCKNVGRIQEFLLCSKDFTSANSLRFGYSATIQNVRNGQSHLTTAINKEDDKTFKRE